MKIQRKLRAIPAIAKPLPLNLLGFFEICLFAIIPNIIPKRGINPKIPKTKLAIAKPFTSRSEE
jgi:hypothetical protein